MSETKITSPAAGVSPAIRPALLQILNMASTPLSGYHLAVEVLYQGLLLPQEHKGEYINSLSGLYLERGVASDEWIKFRGKLQQYLLKGQALVQGAEMLLRDWQLEAPALKQFEMTFPTVDVAQAPGGDAYDPQTGELREAPQVLRTGEV